MAARSFSFELHRTSSAEAPVLFAMVSDGARWSEWAAPLVPSSQLVIEGDPAPGGVGAIRKLGIGPLGVREQTVKHEQDRLHGYALLSSAPMRDYRAEVRLTPREGGGTDITWSGTLIELIPGTGAALERSLRALLSRLATKLARAGEHHAS